MFNFDEEHVHGASESVVCCRIDQFQSLVKVFVIVDVYLEIDQLVKLNVR